MFFFLSGDLLVIQKGADANQRTKPMTLADNVFHCNHSFEYQD